MKRIVMFDKGDLLTDNRSKWVHFFREARRFHPGFDESRANDVRRSVLRLSHVGQITHEEETVEFLKRMGMESAVIPTFLEQVEREGLNKSPLFPGVRETLLELKGRGWELCIVSDTAKTAKELMEDVEDIEDLIDRAYSSADFGKQKGGGLLPEVLAIEAPDEAWFVCHDDDEYEAGLAAGIRTIQLKDGSEIERVLELIP